MQTFALHLKTFAVMLAAQKTRSLMKRHPVTIKDVAAHAHVHFSTVSRALSTSTLHLVKPHLAERVQQAARDLGYSPNPHAVGLKTNRAYLIGVLVPDLSDPIFPPIVTG